MATSIATGILVAHRVSARLDGIMTAIEAESQHWEGEAHYWKNEAARWRTRSVQLAQENEAWRAGLVEGRADVISMVPMLVAAAQSRPACTCGAAFQAETDNTIRTLTAVPPA